MEFQWKGHYLKQSSQTQSNNQVLFKSQPGCSISTSDGTDPKRIIQQLF